MSIDAREGTTDTRRVRENHVHALPRDRDLAQYPETSCLDMHAGHLATKIPPRGKRL